MAGGEAGIWVCGDCRSVNNLRAKQCYNCRTPRDLAAVDPSKIEGTGHGKLREIALPEFHASRGEALLASILILAVAGMQVVSAVVTARVLTRFLGGIDPTESDVLTVTIIGLVTLAFGLFALTAWAFWLSRVVMAMPALGLGYPAANGLMAFVENFLPGLNLFRVPAIVRDVIRRLEPGQGRGEALIFAAWIGLLGGFFLPRIGGFLNAFGADTIEGAVRNELLVQGGATGLVLVGAIFLVALIWWIEERIVRRRAEQLARQAAASGAGAAVAGAAVAGAAVAGAAVGGAAPVEVPGEPRLAAVGGAAPVGGAASVGPQAAPLAPAAPDRAPGPLGSVPATTAFDPALNRPITAVTGAASFPAPPSSQAPPTQAPPQPAADAPAAGAPSAAQAPAPAATPPLAHVPTGPRLQLRVESATSMIATLDGESEVITLNELRAAAGALARADGSAAIATAATTVEARSLAEQAFEALSDARVPTTLED